MGRLLKKAVSAGHLISLLMLIYLVGVILSEMILRVMMEEYPCICNVRGRVIWVVA